MKDYSKMITLLLMIEFELDIPSLSEEGIEMRYEGFENVNVLTSASMIGLLLMNEMLIVLIDSFGSKVSIYW